MKQLLEGYQRFRANGWLARSGEFASLARNGQSPKALVIACVDSRVDPAMIFDAGPGEILSIRNVANLVPPYEPDTAYHGTSAAIEFGVRVLQVRHIIVLGHSQCGGVQALLRGAPETAREFVAPWMSIARDARTTALARASADERQLCCEEEVVKASLRNLLTFPWIADLVPSGKLELHGMWFDIATGALKLLARDGSFVPAETAAIGT